MSERHLATVRSVSAIVTLFDKEGNPAQSVEGVFLDGWFSIVQRGDFKVGDNVLYLEIDSVLNPELAWVQTYAPFMEKHHWRLKTLKLNSLRLPDENGAPSPYPPISQGLVLPMQAITDAQAEKNDAESLDALLGIEKYERPVKAMSGDARGSFPGHIHKTDEERIQNFAEQIGFFMGKPWVATYKMDGSSTTVWLGDEGELRIASRTLELYYDEANYFSKAAMTQPGIKPLLAENPAISAVQGEAIGEGVQGNPHGVKGHRLVVFNLIDRASGLPIPYTQMAALCAQYDIACVKVHSSGDSFEMTPKACIELVSTLIAIDYGQIQGKRSKWAEGLVFRLNGDKPQALPNGENASFKAINPNYLLDNGE